MFQCVLTRLVRLVAFLLLLQIFCTSEVLAGQKITLVLNGSSTPRYRFAVDKLRNNLKARGYDVIMSRTAQEETLSIYIGTTKDTVAHFKKWMQYKGYGFPRKKEGYMIRSVDAKTILMFGFDESGILYGIQELNRLMYLYGKLPEYLDTRDAPQMVLRGTCIGLQKPYYLPGRTVYEYPYTPESFPWFYDKKLWIQTLDRMLENKMNSLYLWNGHPFASLVKLKEYPYAVEVDDTTFQKNEAMYRFIAQEADKRGIWLIQMFYNILVSKPFAEHHQIKTQDRERPITPLLSDYTRKSIAAFVAKYPNVGLMVCLGEAMEGTGKDDVDWFTQTIIPGVKDGLAKIGKKEEPPIVLRAHDTDAPMVMKAALPLYKNLYTEAKFNGEALTTYEPRGAWADLHQTLSKLGSVQIENVHILANLEPFRYGATEFIQRSVQGMHKIMGGNGLHLYPQASYWDWPYTADSVKGGGRLLQIDRDWLWYKSWGRYAWNADHTYDSEKNYWATQLQSYYQCSFDDARKIVYAYEEMGQIAPKLLRRFGITDGNRQTLTLGMLMNQLINPKRFGLFILLYESESPEGEMLIDYAEKEWKQQPHIGETPVQIMSEVLAHGKNAVEAIASVSGTVQAHREEFDRLQNDIVCYDLLAQHYAQKAAAALKTLRYKYSHDWRDLEKAYPLLQQSVHTYKLLADRTAATYKYANSMQTQQRKIPIRGVNGTFKTWTEVLVPFEKELFQFRHAIDSLKKSTKQHTILPAPLTAVTPTTLTTTNKQFKLEPGAAVFADTTLTITAMDPALKALKGLQQSIYTQRAEGTVIQFECKEAVKLCIGYVQGQKPGFMKAPELETNAAANDFGQAEIKIANALLLNGDLAVNVHTYSFPAGKHVLILGKGACLILGFCAEKQLQRPYDAGITVQGLKNELDFLFDF